MRYVSENELNESEREDFEACCPSSIEDLISAMENEILGSDEEIYFPSVSFFER